MYVQIKSKYFSSTSCVSCSYADPLIKMMIMGFRKMVKKIHVDGRYVTLYSCEDMIKRKL